MIVIGLILAVVAVAIVAAVVTISTRSKHRNVPVIVEPVREAAAAEPSDDAGAVDTNVTPAPTLQVDPTNKWQPKDGGKADPCGALKRAQDRDASAALIDKLQQKCRATKTPTDPGYQ